MRKLISLYKISLYKQLSYKTNFCLELIIWGIYALLPLFLVNLFLLNTTENTSVIQFSNLMYGIIYISYNFARMIARGLDDYSQLLFSGDLDVYFTRPLPILSQVMASSLFIRRLSGMAAGIIALLRSYYIDDAFPIYILLFLIVSLSIMYLGLLMISASITTITVKGTLLSNFLVDSSANIGFYPTDILHSPAKEIFTFIIPIYACLYLPLKLSHDKNITFALLASLGVSSAVFIIGIFLFNILLKKYRSVNG